MINLSKNRGVTLSKACEQCGVKALTDINLGIGWKQNKANDIDLDAWVACVDNGVMAPSADSIVYFSHKSNYSGKIRHLGDNLRGGDGESDNETINIKLAELPKKCSHLFVGVTVYGAEYRKQTFAALDKAFARLYDKATGIDILRYSDSITGELGNYTSVLLGAFVKDKVSGEWKFIALGKGLDIDRISGAMASKINEIIPKLNTETHSGDTGSNKNNSAVGTNATAERKKTMAVSLNKGSKVSLAKVAQDAGITSLLNIIVGLGWDTNRYDGGDQFDLDASVFMLGADGKVRSEDDFIFYNKTSDVGSRNGNTWVVDEANSSVIHTGDNRTGEGDGDDEQIKIALNKIPADVQRIAFTVTIDQADKRGQSFGMVENSFIRVVDADTNTPLIRYDLGEDFSCETAIVVAELYRHNGEWKFNPIGSGFAGGLAALCGNFGIQVG